MSSMRVAVLNPRTLNPMVFTIDPVLDGFVRGAETMERRRGGATGAAAPTSCKRLISPGVIGGIPGTSRLRSRESRWVLWRR